MKKLLEIELKKLMPGQELAKRYRTNGIEYQIQNNQAGKRFSYR